MLAAAIRVDRAVEADVGRGVARDDRPGMFDGYRGAERRRVTVDIARCVEPVAIRLSAERAGAHGARIRRRAAAADEGPGRGRPPPGLSTGRAACRGRGGPDGSYTGVAGTVKKK